MEACPVRTWLIGKSFKRKASFELHHYYGRSQGRFELLGDDVATIERYKPLTPDMNVVVIGCGYGRESAMIAPHVRHVYGIDVSRTILDKAEKFVTSKGVSNFTSVLAEQWKDSIPAGIDIVYSMVVFQHLTRDLVRDYVNGLAAKLLPLGVFVCQFANLVYDTADAVDKTYEPSVRWNRDEITQLVKDAGLTLFRIDTQEIPGKGYWHWAFFGRDQARLSDKERILFYYAGLHNTDRPFAGTNAAMVRLAQATASACPDMLVHMTGDYVTNVENYGTSTILPLPTVDERSDFLASFTTVIFATHIKAFQDIPKAPGQRWLLHQHCWYIEADALKRIYDFRFRVGICRNSIV